MKLFEMADQDLLQDDAPVVGYGSIQKRAGDENSRVVSFIFSTATKDRVGDIVEQDWQLGPYRKNPVVLLNHRDDTVVGKTVKMYVRDGNLCGDVEFAGPEISEIADRTFKLVKGGYMNACSVRFQSKEREILRDKEGHYVGMKFKSPILLELSIVSVPCNAEAIRIAKSMGCDDIFNHDATGIKSLPGLDLSVSEDEEMTEIKRAKTVEVDGVVHAYDEDEKYIGQIKGGRLHVTKAYQNLLAGRNIEAIAKQQSEAAKPADEVKASPPSLDSRYRAEALLRSIRHRVAA